MGGLQLAQFGLEDLLECSSRLRSLGQGATSLEAAAGEIVRYLRGQFVDKATGEQSLSLVRFYKTLPFERLEPELQSVALAAEPAGGSLVGVPCLTLLATAGEEPAWNDRRASRAHRAIPLPSPAAIARLPMVAGLVTELGLDPRDVVNPSPERLASLDRHQCDVFYVPDAVDSPLVPAQNDFVIPYSIRSVLGFGGVLPNGSMFAVVMFSHTPIPRETAEAFHVVALSAKVAVLPFVERQTFESRSLGGAMPAPLPVDRALRIAESQVEALNQLLDASDRAVTLQSSLLRVALQDAEDRAEEVAASQALLSASEARKAAIVGGALDGIISIDGGGRVLEFNPAAEATFGYSRDEVIGEELADLIMPEAMARRHRAGLLEFRRAGIGPILNRRVEVTARRRDGTELPVELTVTPVAGSDPPIFTGYLRDITERLRSEAELLASRERLAHIAHTLQASLLLPQLPEIPGLELASAYRPAGEGNDVGGDFYDAFELSESRWALALGDVCGKGPEAAAVTALVRYTLRAAAIRSPHDPSAVLAELHRAMASQRPDSYCTLAYAVMQPDLRRVDIVLGGHPSALLVTRAGVVTQVGGRGPIIGLIDHWAGTSDAITLSPGDAIVLYSDGVTEARRDRELFGVERLEAAVRSAAAHGAAGIVRAIDRAVGDFATVLGDDFAILAAAVR